MPVFVYIFNIKRENHITSLQLRTGGRTLRIKSSFFKLTDKLTYRVDSSMHNIFKVL